MPDEDVPPDGNVPIISEPITAAIQRIRNEILLTAVAFGVIMAWVAINGRLSYEAGFLILSVFFVGLLVYVRARQNVSGPRAPPGEVMSASEPLPSLGWTAPKELFLPDPLTILKITPQTKAVRFEIAFRVSSNEPLWVFLAMRSDFQAIVFIPDMLVRVWNWKSFRREHIPASRDDVRILRTVGGGTNEELEFHGWYRTMFAVTDTAIRKKLPLYYEIYVSDNGRRWAPLTGPKTIYVTLVSDERKAREIMGMH